jgi:hypothetical protein
MLSTKLHGVLLCLFKLLYGIFLILYSFKMGDLKLQKQDSRSEIKKPGGRA